MSKNHIVKTHIGRVVIRTTVAPGDEYTAPTRVLLQLRTDDGYHEWVVHYQNMQTKGLYDGHYTNSLAAAAKVFEKRQRHLGLLPMAVEVL